MPTAGFIDRARLREYGSSRATTRGVTMWRDRGLRGLIAFLIVAFICVGSPALRAQGTDAATTANANKLAQVLKQSGYTYTTHRSDTWSIDLQRKNIGKVKIITSVGADIVVLRDPGEEGQYPEERAIPRNAGERQSRLRFRQSRPRQGRRPVRPHRHACAHDRRSRVQTRRR